MHSTGTTVRIYPTSKGREAPARWRCWSSSCTGQKDMSLNDEFPRSVGAQYATGDQWRNNSRKNEGMEPKQKQHRVVDVTGHGSKA